MSQNKVTVTYLKHSGFLLETKSKYLLFDYWEGKLPKLETKKPLYIFASHIHHDHYNKSIFKLENACVRVQYLLSFDIEAQDTAWKKAENVTFLQANQSYRIDDLTITTYPSTDEGIAFLVKTDGDCFYHAGDLHWWHWPGEPDEYNDFMKSAYQNEINKLQGENIRCAFVVLDPRQEEAGGWGMDYFLQTVGAAHVFPMHVWEDYKLIESYKKANDRKYITSHIVEIHTPGESFLCD